MMRTSVIRAAARAAARSAMAPRLVAAPLAASRFAAPALAAPVRAFSAHGDGSLEGRYASALLVVAKDQKKLDDVHGNIVSLRTMMTENAQFADFVRSPAIGRDDKMAVFAGLTKPLKLEEATLNFLATLLENKRMSKLDKIADVFVGFVRAARGEILCSVTSAAPLSDKDLSAVKAALTAKAPKGSTLAVTTEVKTDIMGGLVVKMGDQVFDFSVATKVDRLETAMSAPLA